MFQCSYRPIIISVWNILFFGLYEGQTSRNLPIRVFQGKMLPAYEQASVLWVRVCSLWYLTCNAHAPYCHLWPVRLHHIFPHYLINGTIFERKKSYWHTKCVFWFSLLFLSETFLLLRRIQRDRSKMYIGRHVKYPLNLPDFKETSIFSTCRRRKNQRMTQEKMFIHF